MKYCLGLIFSFSFLVFHLGVRPRVERSAQPKRTDGQVRLFTWPPKHPKRTAQHIRLDRRVEDAPIHIRHPMSV
jgi:hypothetical protein